MILIEYFIEFKYLLSGAIIKNSVIALKTLLFKLH